MLRPKKKKKRSRLFKLEIRDIRATNRELAGLKNREIRSAALEQGSETVRLTVNP